MKKTILILLLGVFGLQMSMVAQRYAFVDTDYVLRNIPAYQASQEQLNQLSQQWQGEIEARYQEVAQLYQDFQTESVFLSNEMRIGREEAIIEKEKEAKALQHKYFGPEGEMAKRQESLIQPIQEQIATVIQEMAREEDLAAVFDKSTGVLYLDPRHDRSDQILERLGHK
ncbi:OmpH family outer membrane protein [Geofilum rubicundum]|uniref:Outer membrane protein H n=1 Tax=Geofilum rubicundum JCM 15548 TaxID=1236989 RepID=A0A0E9LZF1_9BACT|nr:OmpH family outer membrane protein [Geofilum rubicundum]GAO30937.1 outer membrane protein H precursor [Geofilum rubicundum JCM 15548]